MRLEAKKNAISAAIVKPTADVSSARSAISFGSATEPRTGSEIVDDDIRIDKRATHKKASMLR
jgi:hypothetical protein